MKTNGFLDPRDAAVVEKIGSMIEELRAFEGERVADAIEATAHMMRRDRREEDRRLRSELVRSVPSSRLTGFPDRIDPEDTRTALFQTVWELGYAPGEQGDLFSADRERILETAAARLQIEPDLLIDMLYADTPGERRLVFPPGQPTEIAAEAIRTLNRERLRRMLRGALRLTLRIPVRTEGQASFVQLLWGAKRLGLMIDAFDQGDAILLLVAGPHALFSRTTMYGNRLFQFGLLALRHGGPDWRMHAELLHRESGRADTLRTVTLAAPDAPCFLGDTPGREESLRSGDEEAFQKYFSRYAPDLELVYEGKIVTLVDGKRKLLMVPDFIVRTPHESAEILIEIIGYWRKEYLERKIEKIRLLGNRRLVLVVNSTLSVGREELASPAFDRVRLFFYSNREELKMAVKTLAQELGGRSK